jgi:hypothetical protein
MVLAQSDTTNDHHRAGHRLDRCATSSRSSTVALCRTALHAQVSRAMVHELVRAEAEKDDVERLSSISSDMADRCLRISRRTTNVLELIIETCDDHRVNSALTFVRKSPDRSSCPTSIGRLSLQSDLNQYDRNLMFTDSTYHLSVGCDTHDQLITSLIGKGSYGA